MTKVTELHDQWLSKPDYQKTYEKFRSEFEFVGTVMAAQKQTDLPESELPKGRVEKRGLSS